MFVSPATFQTDKCLLERTWNITKAGVIFFRKKSEITPEKSSLTDERA